MKKLLISLLLTLLVLSTSFTLIACDKNPTSPADSGSESAPDSLPGESESDSEPEGTGDGVISDVTVHNIIENGVVNYAIIRPDRASAAMIAPASDLYECLAALSSEMIRFETDYTMDYLMTGSHNQEAYEIIIGDTIYEYSATAYEGLGYGEYRITTEGNKIYVAAPTSDGLHGAVNYLISVFRSNYDSATGSLSVNAADIEKQNVYNPVLNSIPAIEGAKLSFLYDCGDESNMLAFEDCTEEMYDKFVAKLKELDYKEYTSTEMNENKFITLTKEKKIYNVTFTPSDKMMRVIIDIDSRFTLPEYDKDWDSSKKVCDSLLIQVGTSPKDNAAQNGECYLIRCEDGRFLVWDGGFGPNEEGLTPRNCHTVLYNTLVKYTPAGQKPTIAAWIFTHGHADHVGAVSKFAAAYSSKVDVDQFVYNFPSLDTSVNTYGVASTRGVLNAMSKYYPNAELVKAHPGQLFKYANVEMEMLYTLEFYAPKVLDFYNTASLVNRVWIYGQSIMMSGDMSEDANAICRKYYNKFLESDFYQVAHHGATGGTNAFNKLCNPRWVLWPRGEGSYAAAKGYSINSYLSSKDSRVEIHFPAFFNTTVINLPFDGKSTSFEVYPNA